MAERVQHTATYEKHKDKRLENEEKVVWLHVHHNTLTTHSQPSENTLVFPGDAGDVMSQILADIDICR